MWLEIELLCPTLALAEKLAALHGCSSDALLVLKAGQVMPRLWLSKKCCLGIKEGPALVLRTNSSQSYALISKSVVIGWGRIEKPERLEWSSFVRRRECVPCRLVWLGLLHRQICLLAMQILWLVSEATNTSFTENVCQIGYEAKLTFIYVFNCRYLGHTSRFWQRVASRTGGAWPCAGLGLR